jgi:dTDP-4-dehydrorhamnose 3,5-epimerase
MFGIQKVILFSGDEMKIETTDLPGVLLITPQVFADSRGFFQESFNKARFDKFGISNDFIQDNHSFSLQKGTIRGFHFQTNPKAQSKLVRCVKGSILDVVVDIQPSSKNFRKYIAVELSDSNFRQIYVPKGYAHAFCTLMDDVHVCYKVDEYYSVENNAGILWNDPEINFSWPTQKPILSDQDQKWPKLADFLKSEKGLNR